MGMFSIQIIEYATYLYVRSMSLNDVVDVLRAWFEKDIFSKAVILSHIIKLIDRIPPLEEVTLKFSPNRSGYYAWDGLWMKYKNDNIVLLICLDVVTLDIISYHIAKDENYFSYGELIEKINHYESEILANAKGFLLDGELGLKKQLQKNFPLVPIQLCAFHRYSRIGQIIPFVRARGEDKVIKAKVEKVIFAPTKQEALTSLVELKRYAQEHQQNKKLKEIIGVLKRNFDLLITHFDNPEMSPYNNTLEGFNHLIKRKLRMMKSFKKKNNIDRWIKILLLNYRFHVIKSSYFKNRNGKSPLQLAGVKLPKHFNWIKLLRKNFKIGT